MRIILFLISCILAEYETTTTSTATTTTATTTSSSTTTTVTTTTTSFTSTTYTTTPFSLGSKESLLMTNVKYFSDFHLLFMF